MDLWFCQELDIQVLTQPSRHSVRLFSVDEKGRKEYDLRRFDVQSKRTQDGTFVFMAPGLKDVGVAKAVDKFIFTSSPSTLNYIMHMLDIQTCPSQCATTDQMKVSNTKVECEHTIYDDRVSTNSPEKALSVIRDYSRNFDGFQTDGRPLVIRDVDGDIIDEFTLNTDLAKNQIKALFSDALRRIEKPFNLGSENVCLVFSEKRNQRPQPLFLRKSETLRIVEGIGLECLSTNGFVARCRIEQGSKFEGLLKDVRELSLRAMEFESYQIFMS